MKELLGNITKNELVELTEQQQRDIIQYCKENTRFLGRGSSRATFEFKEFPDIVIKIIVDSKGEYQKNKEIEIYNMLGNEFLTTIYAYGDYFTICEKVDAFETDEVSNSLCEYFEGNIIEDGGKYGQDDMPYIQNVVDALSSELGETPDNCQIGRSLIDGRIVSFDFGYETGSNRYSVSDQLGYVYRYFDEPNMMFGYLLNEVGTDYGFIEDQFHVDFDEYANADEENYDDVEEEFDDNYDDAEEQPQDKTVVVHLQGMYAEAN